MLHGFTFIHSLVFVGIAGSVTGQECPWITDSAETAYRKNGLASHWSDEGRPFWQGVQRGVEEVLRESGREFRGQKEDEISRHFSSYLVDFSPFVLRLTHDQQRLQWANNLASGIFAYLDETYVRLSNEEVERIRVVYQVYLESVVSVLNSTLSKERGLIVPGDWANEEQDPLVSRVLSERVSSVRLSPTDFLRQVGYSHARFSAATMARLAVDLAAESHLVFTQMTNPFWVNRWPEGSSVQDLFILDSEDVRKAAAKYFDSLVFGEGFFYVGEPLKLDFLLFQTTGKIARPHQLEEEAVSSRVSAGELILVLRP